MTLSVLVRFSSDLRKSCVPGLPHRYKDGESGVFVLVSGLFGFSVILSFTIWSSSLVFDKSSVSQSTFILRVSLCLTDFCFASGSVLVPMLLFDFVLQLKISFTVSIIKNTISGSHLRVFLIIFCSGGTGGIFTFHEGSVWTSIEVVLWLNFSSIIASRRFL